MGKAFGGAHVGSCRIAIALYLQSISISIYIYIHLLIKWIFTILITLLRTSKWVPKQGAGYPFGTDGSCLEAEVGSQRLRRSLVHGIMGAEPDSGSLMGLFCSLFLIVEFRALGFGLRYQKGPQSRSIPTYQYPYIKQHEHNLQKNMSWHITCDT